MYRCYADAAAAAAADAITTADIRTNGFKTYTTMHAFSSISLVVRYRFVF